MMSHNIRTEKLNGLGVALVAKLLGLKVTRYHNTDSDGHEVRIKVQNRFRNEKLGDCFTMDESPSTVQLVNSPDARIVFVDYDDPRLIRVYECLSKSDYEMQYCGGGASWRVGLDKKRIVLCFPITKMKLVAEIAEPEILAEMKSLSDAKKYNLDSSQYGRMAT